MTRRLAAATLSFVLASLAAPFPAEASSGTLAHGGSYIVQPDTTLASSAVGLWFRAPSSGYDNAMPGIGRVAATAAAAATLESGKSLVELVRSLGGRLTINVYPDIIGVTIVAPAGATRRIVAAMSAAYFSPSIGDDAFKTALRDAAVLIAERKYSSDDLLHDALFAQIFTSGPAHESPLPASVPDLAQMPIETVVKYAQRAFRSANATLTLAGNVDPSVIDAITAGSPGSPDAPYDSKLAAALGAPSSMTAKVDGLGLAWPGPAIGDERSATALDFVSDYLFRDETGIVSKQFDPTGDTYVSGQFITLHDPGVMLVTIGGSKLDDARDRVVEAVRKLQVPLDPATFAAAREAFLYHLAIDSQTPGEQADNLGWYSVEGNAAYAPSDGQGMYWKIAQSLDPAFIASVVKRYLDHPVIIRMTTGPAAAKEPSS